MQQLPPIVLECPECGEKYLISRDSYSPSEQAIIYSDGFFFDETNWRTPYIIGCVTCELGFFPENGKIIAKPDWDEFHEEWSQVKKAEPPTAGSLALELRARKKMSRSEELALRTEFWYSGLHAETGRLLMSKNKKFKQFWEDSLDKLEAILTTDNAKDLLLKAEINRQLGRFSTSIDLLNKLEDPIAKQIVENARKQNSALFKIVATR